MNATNRVVSLPIPRTLAREIEPIINTATELGRMLAADFCQRSALADVLANAEGLIATGTLDRLTREVEQARAPASENDIRMHLAMLIAANHKADGRDTLMFARIMVEDLKERAPSRFAVEIAFKTLRQTEDWLPSEAKVLAAIKAADGRIAWASESMGKLPELVTRGRERQRTEAASADQSKRLTIEELRARTGYPLRLRKIP